MMGWSNMMGGYFGGGMGIFGLIFGFLFFVLVVIGIILLIVWLVRGATRISAEDKTGNKALEVLGERYAKGEVSKEQYDNMKKDLMH